MSEYLAQLFDLQARTALITGSSQGLGAEIAIALAGAGATVILNGRNEESLTNTADRLAAIGLKVDTSVFDVADAGAARRGLGKIRERHGAVDILVSNVGQRSRSVAADQDLDLFRRVLDVNVLASYRLAAELAVGMAGRGWGRILFVSSVAARYAAPLTLAYGASKAALESMTRSFAIEYAASGVTANALAPGSFATESNRPYAEAPGAADRIPARRWGRPDEIAGAALFLASPAASYINGHILTVDGGMTAIMSTYASAPLS